MFRLTRQACDAPVSDLRIDENDLARALEEKWSALYFPTKLERLFERETQHARSRHLVTVGILWMLVGALSALIVSASPAGSRPFGMSPAIRLGVVTPILASVTFAVWWGVKPFVRELLMMLACIIAPASVILGAAFTPGGDIGANRGALTIILLFITVVVRLRFWYAAVACSVLVALQISVPAMLHASPPSTLLLSLITIAATLSANYSLEREYRLNYLQRLSGRIQGAKLAEMVEQLHDLSQSDPLTGLANRRAMDTWLEDLSARNQPYAMILVDIDAFKSFNDCYGHQVGDDCLRRVAAMLRASLRFTADRVARMGGEEFAVVLPNTGVEAARCMAERMRKSVCGLSIPHSHSPTGKVVTISAGVSASTGNKSSATVVAEADKALYRAKLSGRNRVEVASSDVAEPMVLSRRRAIPA